MKSRSEQRLKFLIKTIDFKTIANITLNWQTRK